MKFTIIVSKKDPAGLNIKTNLLKYFKESAETFENNEVYSYKNAKLYTIEEDSIYFEDVDKKIDSDFFIFATKHKSDAGINSLSVHCPGNWNKAEFGGKERTLGISSGLVQREAFLILSNLAKKRHNVSVEQTHHGPYLEKPAMFIEIGSSLEQWQNKEAGKIIAETIIKLISKEIPKSKVAILLGGGHYNQSANKVLLKTNIAISHICAKFLIPFLNKDMVSEAIRKTKEKVDFFILDWKGLGKEKLRIKSLLEELEIDYKRTDQLWKGLNNS